MDALRFGRQFHVLRIRQQKRQADVAIVAGVSRPLIGSIDCGELDGITVGSLVRSAAALGADVDVRLRWRGEQLDRLLDRDHALVVESVVARLRRHGWTVEVEASFNHYGERGSIDVLAWHRELEALLVVECKSVVPDSQATLHGLDCKARIAVELARARDWRARHVSRLLIVASSAAGRRRIAALASTYGVSFPVRGSAARSYLRRPVEPIRGLVFVSIDGQSALTQRVTGRQRVRKPKRARTTATNTLEQVAAPKGPGWLD